jgi:hypothetical protein
MKALLFMLVKLSGFIFIFRTLNKLLKQSQMRLNAILSIGVRRRRLH